MSKRKIRAALPPRNPYLRMAQPGAGSPRLSWADWLRLYALEVARSIPGVPGAFLAQYIGGLAEQALVLGAVDPDSHLALAQAEQERKCLDPALEAEAADPGGSWEPTDASTGSLDGHDAAQQYWIGSDLDDLTYRN